MIGALALADFRDRVRRPVFAVTLLAAVALGYLSVPPTDATYTTFSFDGGYRGTYDSAYLGSIVALAAGMWLSLLGFYVVKNTIARDRATHVGQILAATPMRNVAYLCGKWLSNLLVLGAMTVVIAVLTVFMQLLRGESSSIDVPAMWTPFVVITLPTVGVTAALAVVFETIPLLRSGMGNITWVFVWMAGVFTAQPSARSGGWDLLGMNALVHAMGAELARAHPRVSAHPTASLGLTTGDGPLSRFDWSGQWITAQVLTDRGVMLVAALAVVLVAAVWLNRFDPARGPGPSAIDRALAGLRARPAADAAFGEASAVLPMGIALPRTPVVRGPAVFGLLAGELRVLFVRTRWWWRAGALGLMIGGLFAPIYPMLLLAWIWPVFCWSRLGTQQYEHGVDGLLAGTPNPRLRLFAEWLAGITVTAVVGGGSLVHLALSADGPGVAVWCAGALFIPALALALGTVTRSDRPFQAIYLIGWYLVLSASPAPEFGRAGYLAGLALALTLMTFLARELRESHR